MRGLLVPLMLLIAGLSVMAASGAGAGVGPVSGAGDAALLGAAHSQAELDRTQRAMRAA